MNLAALRTWLLARLAVGCLLAPLIPAVLSQNLHLENEHYAVVVTQPHGLIQRILDKTSGLDLLVEPRLADNFRFTLPIRGATAWQSTEANVILGREQRLRSHEQTATRLALTWGPPLRNRQGQRYPVSATMTLELTGEDLRFTLHLRNRSRHEIGEVSSPILGGLLGLGATPELRRQTDWVLPEPLAVRSFKPFQSFANHSWLGVFGPEQFYSYPDKLAMPWWEWNHPQLARAVYLGAHDPIARYKVLHLEMSPGIAPSRTDGNWPHPDELAGAPAGLKASFVHFPYQPAGQDFTASPVVLRFHAGDWHEGARIYGSWLTSQPPSPSPPLAPARPPLAFQECDAVPFRDLPRWAEAGTHAGVRSLLLRRWSAANLSSTSALFEPDPQLGSREEFAAALRHCHTLGVKVAVLISLPPISQLTEAYRRDLHRYAARDRWGILYTTVAPGEPSPLTGGFGSGERRVWLNPGHPRLRHALTPQIRSLAELGVDGIHVEDFFHPALDFNPTLDRTPDRASWEAALDGLKDLLAASRQVRPDFTLSTDAVWDRVLALSPACSAEARDRSPLRVAFPDWQPSFTIADDDATGAIHQALRYRARLRLAPADRQPVGGPATAAIVPYLRAILTARDLLSHTLLDGQPVAAQQARLDGLASYTVFRNATTGLRTLALVNPRATPATVRFAGFDPADQRPVHLWLPTRSATPVETPVRFELPGRQLALLTEEDAARDLPILAVAPPTASTGQVVFDLASEEDLEGWTLRGEAFRVGAVPGLFTKPTLNSLAAAGETATGTALSPPFTLTPPFDHVEFQWQGGWSEASAGQPNLALQLLDAANNTVLAEWLPPGTHELRTRRESVSSLIGRTVRLRLIDANRNASYAWIGLRKLALVGPSPAPPAR